MSYPSISTDPESARRKALEVAGLINTGRWRQENDEQLAHWLEFFEGTSRVSFINTLRDAIGEKITESETELKQVPGSEAYETEESRLSPAP
jgi:hypothetical protein